MTIIFGEMMKKEKYPFIYGNLMGAMGKEGSPWKLGFLCDSVSLDLLASPRCRCVCVCLVIECKV